MAAIGAETTVRMSMREGASTEKWQQSGVSPTLRGQTPPRARDRPLIVFAEFDFAAMFPAEDNALGVHNFELAANETRVLKI